MSVNICIDIVAKRWAVEYIIWIGKGTIPIPGTSFLADAFTIMSYGTLFKYCKRWW